MRVFRITRLFYLCKFIVRLCLKRYPLNSRINFAPSVRFIIMEEKQDKKGSKKKLKDSLKAVTTAAILAGGLLASTSSPVKANDARAKVGNLQHRVEIVRNA